MLPRRIGWVRVGCILFALAATRGRGATTRSSDSESELAQEGDARDSHIILSVDLPAQDANASGPKIGARIDWTTRTLELVATGWPRLAAAELRHTMPHTLAEADTELRRRLREATLALPLGWPLGAPVAAAPGDKKPGPGPQATPGPRAAATRRLPEVALRPLLLPSQVRRPGGEASMGPQASAVQGAYAAPDEVPRVGTLLAEGGNTALYALVDGAVGHYRAERTTFGADGRIEITASLPLDGASEALGGLWPRLRRLVPTALGISRQGLTPKGASQAARVQARRTTGLIIQAKKLGAEPCLWPRLYDADGHLLYGPELIGDEVLASRGVASFSRSLELARRDERVGEQPQVVRALQSLRPHASDLVIDVGALPQGEVLSELFAEARVLIVLD